MQSAQEFTIGQIQTTTIDGSPVKSNKVYTRDISDTVFGQSVGSDAGKTGISKSVFARDFSKRY